MNTEIVPAHDRSPVPADPTADVLDRLADFLRLNVAEGDAAESTIRVYLIHIRQFVEWAAGEGVEPALAAHRDLVLYRRWLSEEGYTRATVGTKLAAVRRFYEAAKWHGYRDDNPAEGVKPPREHTSKRDRILARYLSREQVKALLDAPDASTDAGIRDRAMIGLMYYHGLRVSEVAALTVGSVVAGDPPKLSIEQSKGGRDRVVFLIPKTREWLGAWAARRKSHVTDETDGALFVSFGVTAAGTPLTPDGIRWVVNGYLKDLGYYRPGLSCHALRHAHASHVVAAGGDLVALANEMGHASTETTNVYTHVADAVGRNPAALLAETDGE